MRSGTILAGTLTVALFATNVSAANLEAGRQHYAACGACHGEDGRGIKELDAPRIAGLGQWYMMRQVLNYYEGARGTHPDDELGAQVRIMILALPDKQAMQDVVAYIATLEAPLPEPTVEGDVERGEQLYASCAACHGADGQGNQALNAPRLAGQSDWYLVRQLEAFKAGIRGTNPLDSLGAQMRPMALILPDDQAIRDVVAYINTLEPEARQEEPEEEPREEPREEPEA